MTSLILEIVPFLGIITNCELMEDLSFVHWHRERLFYFKIDAFYFVAFHSIRFRKFKRTIPMSVIFCKNVLIKGLCQIDQRYNVYSWINEEADGKLTWIGARECILKALNAMPRRSSFLWSLLWDDLEEILGLLRF